MAKIIHQDRSHNIGKLALALSQAQNEITGAKKDSDNPFFKSKYADLASCWDACRGPLSKNKLAVIQTTEDSDKGVVIITTLVHESGQWISGRLTVQPVKNDPQGLGSAITYGRRYALSAIVGLAQVDDDANAASNNISHATKRPKPKTSADFEKLLDKAKTPAELEKIYSRNAAEIKRLPEPEKDKLRSYYSQLAKTLVPQQENKPSKLTVEV